MHLFPELSTNTYGKKTAEFSDWFNQEFLHGLGITSPSKVFHSFRHLFVDRCREAHLPDTVHFALVGHARSGSNQNYGRGLSIRALAEGLARVSFPGLPAITSPHG